MRLTAIAAAVVLAPCLALAQTKPAEPPKLAGTVAKVSVSWMDRALKGEDLTAVLDTSAGAITVKLFAKDAPKTVANFVGLAAGEKEWTDPRDEKKTTKRLYDGSVFHRVIPQFMIQGGDPLATGTGGPGYTFEDEVQSGRGFDKPCLLAMANRGPNTNGSQFFITEKPTPWLNGKHTIFGEVVEGCELVAEIAAAGNKATTIKSVKLSSKASAK